MIFSASVEYKNGLFVYVSQLQEGRLLHHLNLTPKGELLTYVIYFYFSGFLKFNNLGTLTLRFMCIFN